MTAHFLKFLDLRKNAIPGQPPKFMLREQFLGVLKTSSGARLSGKGQPAATGFNQDVVTCGKFSGQQFHSKLILE